MVLERAQIRKKRYRHGNNKHSSPSQEIITIPVPANGSPGMAYCFIPFHFELWFWTSPAETLASSHTKCTWTRNHWFRGRIGKYRQCNLKVSIQLVIQIRKKTFNPMF